MGFSAVAKATSPSKLLDSKPSDVSLEPFQGESGKRIKSIYDSQQLADLRLKGNFAEKNKETKEQVVEQSSSFPKKMNDNELREKAINALGDDINKAYCFMILIKDNNKKSELAIEICKYCLYQRDYTVAGKSLGYICKDKRDELIIFFIKSYFDSLGSARKFDKNLINAIFEYIVNKKTVLDRYFFYVVNYLCTTYDSKTYDQKSRQIIETIKKISDTSLKDRAYLIYIQYLIDNDHNILTLIYFNNIESNQVRVQAALYMGEKVRLFLLEPHLTKGFAALKESSYELNDKIIFAFRFYLILDRLLFDGGLGTIQQEAVHTFRKKTIVQILFYINQLYKKKKDYDSFVQYFRQRYPFYFRKFISFLIIYSHNNFNNKHKIFQQYLSDFLYEYIHNHFDEGYDYITSINDEKQQEFIDEIILTFVANLKINDRIQLLKLLKSRNKRIEKLNLINYHLSLALLRSNIKGDIQKAYHCANNIYDKTLQSKALKEIALSFLKIRAQASIFIASGIKNIHTKDETFSLIVESLINNQMYFDAANLINKISSNYEKRPSLIVSVFVNIYDDFFLLSMQLLKNNCTLTYCPKDLSKLINKLYDKKNPLPFLQRIISMHCINYTNEKLQEIVDLLIKSPAYSCAEKFLMKMEENASIFGNENLLKEELSRNWIKLSKAALNDIRKEKDFSPTNPNWSKVFTYNRKALSLIGVNVVYSPRPGYIQTPR